MNRPISTVDPGTEGAVTEQISALLADVDAPDRWDYRSLSLLTTGDGTKGGTATGLQLGQHLFCADPKATSGWRCDDPVITTSERIIRLPACWYTSDG